MKKLIMTVILMTAFSLTCLADGAHGTTGGTKPGPSKPSMSEAKQGGTNGRTMGGEGNKSDSRASEKGGTNGKMGGVGNKSETNANGGGGLKNGATGT